MKRGIVGLQAKAHVLTRTAPSLSLTVFFNTFECYCNAQVLANRAFCGAETCLVLESLAGTSGAETTVTEGVNAA